MSRRLTALALLLCFAATWAPALKSSLDSDASSLPPCCRRDGKHRCAMSVAAQRSAQQQQERPTIQSGLERCPYRSMFLAPSARQDQIVAVSSVFFVPLHTDSFFHSYTVRPVQPTEFVAHLKRGPPPVH